MVSLIQYGTGNFHFWLWFCSNTTPDLSDRQQFNTVTGPVFIKPSNFDHKTLTFIDSSCKVIKVFP